MNNDTNPTCPIQGQGYHDTSNTVAVGQTYWWHDDTPFDEINTANKQPMAMVINLQHGARHILYQKQSDGTAPVKLWELIDCRAGSSATRMANSYNFLPWSSYCQPIDSNYSAPISPTEYTIGIANSNGVKQVAVITMRATTDGEGKPTSVIYSPLYSDGIGDIYFDVVNFMTAAAYLNSHIIVEYAVSHDEACHSRS
jgi:hypothetical protein